MLRVKRGEVWWEVGGSVGWEARVWRWAPVDNLSHVACSKSHKAVDGQDKKTRSGRVRCKKESCRVPRSESTYCKARCSKSMGFALCQKILWTRVAL
jgi:hypothetical protein